MRFEWFVARRYLKGAHRGRTYISTAGVTIGVTVLIVVISVMNGFEREFLGKMLGAYGHLRLIPVENGQVITRLYSYEDWIPRFSKEPGVEGVSPIIESGVMIIAESPRNREPQGQFIQVRGIDPIHEGQASDLIRGRLLGEWPELADTPASASSATKTVLIDPFAVEPKTPPIFLGLELAKELYNAPDNWHWSSTDPRLRDFLESEVMGKKVKLVAPRLDRGPSGQELFFLSKPRSKEIFKDRLFRF
jgi:ABC-type transport system, involved in lipoprotein release, permease component